LHEFFGQLLQLAAFTSIYGCLSEAGQENSLCHAPHLIAPSVNILPSLVRLRLFAASI
jgi:hypothetical protein